MAEIRWTKEAERWLKEIHDYISTDNPKAAVQVVDGIRQKVQILKRLPEIGHRYQRYPEVNIRILLYGHYRIVYLVHSDRSVNILGIFHGALQLDRYFLEEKF